MRTVDVPIRLLTRFAFSDCAIRVSRTAATFDRDSDCYCELVRQSCASRGVGDTIAKVAQAVGIAPCDGCKKRRDALNRLFPYGESKRYR
ncbi:MAG: hypothetical protein QOF78_733 [Phycisphaerales bacterium]|jgi:hypothetical protein|nr:hypothetical protein [Phycisphaerales bacterium]